MYIYIENNMYVYGEICLYIYISPILAGVINHPFSFCIRAGSLSVDGLVGVLDHPFPPPCCLLEENDATPT